MENTNRTGAFLMGLGFGTAIGLLLAPKSGSDARLFLQSKGRGAADHLKREGQSLYQRGKEGVQNVQHQVRDRVKHFSHAADAGRLAFQKALHSSV